MTDKLSVCSLLFWIVSFVWLVYLIASGLNETVLTQIFFGELLAWFIVAMAGVVVQLIFQKKVNIFISIIYFLLVVLLSFLHINHFQSVSDYAKKLNAAVIQKAEGVIVPIDSYNFYYDTNHVGRTRTKEQLALGRDDVKTFFFSVAQDKDKRIRIKCSKWNVACKEKIYPVTGMDLGHADVQNAKIKASVYFKKSIDGENILYGLSYKAHHGESRLDKPFFQALHNELHNNYLFGFAVSFGFCVMHLLFSLFLISNYKGIKNG